MSDDPKLRLQYLRETGQTEEAKRYEQYLKETGQADTESATPPTGPRTLPNGLVTRAPANPNNTLRPAPGTGAPIGSQIGAGVSGALNAIRHPVDAVKGIVTGTVRDVGDALAPEEGEAAQGMGRYTTPGLGSLRAIRDLIQGGEGAKPGEMLTRENTPSAVTPSKGNEARLRSAATLATIPLAAVGVPAWLLAPGVGALSDPEQPVRGATAAGLLGAAGSVAGKVAGKAVGSRAGVAVTDAVAGAAEKGLTKLPQTPVIETLGRLAKAAGPTGRASSTIQEAAAKGGKRAGTEADALATGPRANMDVMPGDVLGAGVHDLQGTMYRSGSPAGLDLKAALEERAKGAVPKADAELAQTFGLGPEPNGVPQQAALTAIEAERQQLGQQFKDWYKANPGDINHPRVDEIMQYPVMQKLLARVEAVRSGHPDLPALPERGGGILPGFTPDQSASTLALMRARGIPVPEGAVGGSKPVPDLEAVHQIEQALGHATRNVFEGANPNPLSKMEASAAAPLVKELRDIIAPPGSEADKLFAAYRNNRQKYEALTETGAGLLKTAKNGVALTEAERDIGAQPPDVKAMTKLGVAGAVRDRLLNKQPPGGDMMDQHAATAFPEAANAQRALGTVLTPDEMAAANEMARARGDAFLNRSNTLGGSTTRRFGNLDQGGGVSPVVLARDLARTNKAFLGADIASSLFKRGRAPALTPATEAAAVELLKQRPAPATVEALRTIESLSGTRAKAGQIANGPAITALKALLAQTGRQP